MKAHLTITETALMDGSHVEALCRAEIYPCQIVLMWDSVAMNSPLPLSTLLICRKCWEAILLQPEGSEERRYVYGVTKQQELRATETEEAEMVA